MTIFIQLMQIYFIVCAAYQDVVADNTLESIKYATMAILFTCVNLQRGHR